MPPKRGIGGREVPGAVPVESNGNDAQAANKKKRKKNKKKGAKQEPPGVEDLNVLLSEGEGEAENITAAQALNNPYSALLSSDEDATLVESMEALNSDGEAEIDRITDKMDELPSAAQTARGLPTAAKGEVEHKDISSDVKNSDGSYQTAEEANLSTASTDVDHEAEEGDAEVKRTREQVKAWLESKEYRNLSKDLRHAIVDHLVDIKHPESSAAWHPKHRLILWRAVVRANFWWTNPDSGEWTGRPEPIRAPSGVYESNFEVFVQCAAERLDRVGRDLPTPEYVKEVEDEMRWFIDTVKQEYMYVRLAHLAFLLIFDEARKHKVLAVEDMQERVHSAFHDAEFDWQGYEYMKPTYDQARTPYSPARATLTAAEEIWQEAVADLEI